MNNFKLLDILHLSSIESGDLIEYRFYDEFGNNLNHGIVDFDKYNLIVKYPYSLRAFPLSGVSAYDARIVGNIYNDDRKFDFNEWKFV